MPLEFSETRRVWLAMAEDNEGYEKVYPINMVVKWVGGGPALQGEGCWEGGVGGRRGPQLPAPPGSLVGMVYPINMVVKWVRAQGKVFGGRSVGGKGASTSLFHW